MDDSGTTYDVFQSLVTDGHIACNRYRIFQGFSCSAVQTAISDAHSVVRLVFAHRESCIRKNLVDLVGMLRVKSRNLHAGLFLDCYDRLFFVPLRLVRHREPVAWALSAERPHKRWRAVTYYSPPALGIDTQ